MPNTRAICAASSPDGKKIIISTVQKFPFILDEIGERAPGRTLRDHHRRGAFQPGRADRCRDVHGALDGRCRGRRRDDRGQDQPDHGVAEDAAERQLLRLHRHAEEQDAGDLRRALSASGRRGEASPVPQLHDEAGDSGGLHPGRAQALHAGRTATTGWSRRSKAIRSSTPRSARRRSCAATSRATTMRSGSRPRSWSITSTSR